jgi:hypothetical protein
MLLEKRHDDITGFHAGKPVGDQHAAEISAVA